MAATELRTRFNAADLEGQVAAGKLARLVIEEGHPSPPRARSEPICTKSQLLGYFTKRGVKIAEAHQYLRPDGKVGASGKPDPKAMVEAGRLFMV